MSHSIDLNGPLYHGSYTAVEKPDLNKCREFTDFGKGFYLSSNKQQASDFDEDGVQFLKQQTIRELRPLLYKYQACFRSQEALDNLKFRERVNVTER